MKNKKTYIILAATVIFLLGFLIGYNVKPVNSQPPAKNIILTDEEAEIYKYIRDGMIPPGYSEITPDADDQTGRRYIQREIPTDTP